MNKKIIFIIGIATISVLSLVWCLNPNISKNKSSQAKIEKVSTVAKMGKFYNSFQDFINNKNCDTIVEGTIKEVSYFDFKGNTFTLSKLKVEKSLYGNVKSGDIINYVSNGGITTKGALSTDLKDGEERSDFDPNQKVEILFNGAPNNKTNDKVLLFLGVDREDFFNLGITYYDPIGAFQGIFNIDEKSGKANRFIEGNSMSNAMNGMAVADVEQRIKKAVLDKKNEDNLKE